MASYRPYSVLLPGSSSAAAAAAPPTPPPAADPPASSPSPSPHASPSSAAPNAAAPPPPPPAADPPASSTSPSPPPFPSSLSLPPWDSLPDDVWEHAFSFLPDAGADRGTAGAVCSHWLHAERRSRRRLAVRNCYAVAPSVAVRRFPSVRAAVVKGKPHFSEFVIFPHGWGGHAAPWVEAAAAPHDGWPLLEELRFNRMVVTDDCLQRIAASFRNFQVLRMHKCEGFTAAGLAAITQGCRNFRVLDLQESAIANNPSSDWLSSFPESFTCLESLNFSCLAWVVNITAFERLVGKCRNLKTLKLNNDVPLDKVASLLRKAPQITELGFGRSPADNHPDLFGKVQAAFEGCKSLRRLSGGWGAAVRDYLPAFYCVCEGLTSLDLCYSIVQGPELIEFIGRCRNLLELRVNDLVADHGLSVVAATCRKLQELWVVRSRHFGNGGASGFLTEAGLVEVSARCPMLEKVVFFSQRMTNEALVTVARNRPNLTSFRLAIIGERCSVDYNTEEPFDAGFSAIVQSCRGLRRLSIKAVLTDDGLRSVGAHAHRVEVLSLAYTGDTDLGLDYLLSGCRSLKRLQATHCPFGDLALLVNIARLETPRYLWMSNCKLTMVGCRLLGLRTPRSTVEVIQLLPGEIPPLALYVYRTLAGPRSDAPERVQILQ